MPRVVRDGDDREWVVSARPHLSDPAARLRPVQASDATLRAVVLGISLLLVFVVALATPANLWFPGWLVGPMVLAGAVALVWWVLGRAWTVTAAPGGSDDRDAHDVRVRGPWAARRAHGDLVRHVAARPARPRDPEARDREARDTEPREPEPRAEPRRPGPDEHPHG